VEDVWYAVDAMDQRNGSNTMASLNGRPMNADAPRKAELAIRQHILAHPARRGAHCDVLVQLARTFEEYALGYIVAELAERITRRDFPCLARVLAALPRNDDTSFLVQSRLSDCEQRRGRYCGEIRRAQASFPRHRWPGERAAEER